jgi:hypothetical protein
MQRAESQEDLVPTRPAPRYVSPAAATPRTHLIAGLIGLIVGIGCLLATLTARIPNNRRTWGFYFGNASVPQPHDTVPVPVGHVAPALLLISAVRCIVAAVALRGQNHAFLVHVMRGVESVMFGPMALALIGVVAGVGDIWVLVGLWSNGLTVSALLLLVDKLHEYGSRAEWAALGLAFLCNLTAWSIMLSHWYKTEAPCFVMAILILEFLGWLAIFAVPVGRTYRDWKRTEDTYTKLDILLKCILAIALTAGIRASQDGYLAC